MNLAWFLLIITITSARSSASALPNWEKFKLEEQRGGGLFTCSSDADCNFLGDCLNNKCHCDPGFKGTSCSQLDLLPTKQEWGFNNKEYPSWGGNVVFHDEKYHLFASYMKHRCDISMYATNSAVLRASSNYAHGPFTFEEEVLAPFHHGAHIVKTNAGEFILFADGKNIPEKNVHNCIAEHMKRGMPLHQPDSMKGNGPHDQVVAAFSNSIVNGKWREQVILKTDLTAGWACNRTNPAPLLLLNNQTEEILLAFRTTYCEARADAPVPKCRYGPHKNFCQHLTSATYRLGKNEDGFTTLLETEAAPRQQQPAPVRGEKKSKLKKILALDGCEDPFLFENTKRHTLHLLCHSKNACGENDQGCGLLGYSQNSGKSWTSAKTRAYDSRIRWMGEDGSSHEEILEYRQRPKIYFDPKNPNVPLFLYNGIRRHHHHIQTIAVPFNVPENQHLMMNNDAEKHASFVTTTTTTTTTTTRVAASTNNSNKNKNFILMHLDDVGVGDISAYKNEDRHYYKKGSTRKQTQTPEIDRMASEGILFTSFYSASPVCTPSRAGILTGRYPIRTSLHPGVIGPSDGKGLPHTEVTIAKWLKTKKNYKTMMAGKWHLGHLPPYLPNSHGFDFWTGMPYSHDFCPCPTKLTHTQDNKCREFEPACPRMNNSVIVEQPAKLEELTEYYADSVIEFIAANQHHPFFVYYACHHLHHPQFANVKNIGAGRRAGGREDAFGDAAWEMDFAIGKILNYLREQNQMENTLVFLASDNGAANAYGSLGGSNGVLRCGKGTNWEGGQRVPFIAWGGGIVNPGRISDDLVAGMDLFATIATLADVGVRDLDRKLDSIDFGWILFTNDSAPTTTTRRDSFIYYQLGNHGIPGAVRVGDFKVHFYVSSWMEKLLGKMQSCHTHSSGLGLQKRPLVYNVKKDPGETILLPSGTEEEGKIIAKARRMLREHNCNKPTDGGCFASKQMQCVTTAWFGSIQPWPPRGVAVTTWEQVGYYCCEANKQPVVDALSLAQVGCSCGDREAGGGGFCNPSAMISGIASCGGVICSKSMSNGSVVFACGEKGDCEELAGGESSDKWKPHFCGPHKFQCRDLGVCVLSEAECESRGGLLYGKSQCLEQCGVQAIMQTQKQEEEDEHEETATEQPQEQAEEGEINNASPFFVVVGGSVFFSGVLLLFVVWGKKKKKKFFPKNMTNEEEEEEGVAFITFKRPKIF